MRCARLRQWVTSPETSIGDPADGEVGVGVAHDDGDLGGRIELACPQRRARCRRRCLRSLRGAWDVLSWVEAGQRVSRSFSPRKWGSMTSAASALVMPRVQALDQPERKCTADDLGRDEARDRRGGDAGEGVGDMRPTVMAGLAKLVELVKK